MKKQTTTTSAASRSRERTINNCQLCDAPIPAARFWIPEKLGDDGGGPGSKHLYACGNCCDKWVASLPKRRRRR